VSRRSLLLAAAAAAALALALGAAAPAAGEGGGDPVPPPKPPAGGGEAPGAPGAPYGGVPAGLEPWRGAGEPYFRWFMEKVEFRGPGREEPEPRGLRTVKLGLLAPLHDSPDRVLGVAMRDGMALALEEANRDGGYRGIPFEAVERNDLPLWGASSTSIVALGYDEGVWAILGSVEGNSTHILLRAALKIEVPIVNTADTDPTLVETNIPWILRVIPDDRQECYRLFARCFHEKGLRHLAILRTGERYGRVGVAEFADSLRRAGSPVAADLRYGPGGALPGGTVEKIRAARCDGVLLWGNGDDMGRALKALRASGVDLPVFGPDRMVGEAFLREAGAAAEGATAAFPYDPERDEPRWKAFRGRFRERHGREPDHYAAFGYDGARLLVECVRRAGLNRVRIRDELYALDSWDGGVTGPMRFDPARSNLRPVFLALRSGGRWIHER
jgi:branched-chain amino acid transport system substrate-binding protein